MEIVMMCAKDLVCSVGISALSTTTFVSTK